MADRPDPSGGDPVAAKAAETASERRRRIREMVDRLPEDQLRRAEQLLRAIVEDDAFLWTHATAPIDDEPLTEEERAAVEEGFEAGERGDRHRLEDVERELGR